MRHINFDLQGPVWTPTVSDTLASVLLEYANCFATPKMGLVHHTILSALRTHWISPALAAQVSAVIYSFFAADRIQQSQLLLPNPLVIMSEVDGSIHVSVN